VDQLSRLFANYIVMLYDASVTMHSLRSLKLYEDAIMGGIPLFTQQYGVTLYMVVSNPSVLLVGLLLWNTRLMFELLAKLLALGDRGRAKRRA
jgi:hypothetical protein